MQRLARSIRLLIHPFDLLMAKALFLICLLTGPLLWGQTYRKGQGYLPGDASPTQLIATLTTQYPALQPAAVSLHLASDILSPGGRHLQFWQTYQGLPIADAGLKLNLGRDGRLWSVMHHLRPVQGVAPGARQYDPAQLAPRLAQTLGAERVTYAPQWWWQNGRLIPALRVASYQPGPQHALELYIDARNGQELMRRDLSAACRPPEDDTLGLGAVFLPDPCTRGQVPYGERFTDNDDRDTATLTALIDTVVLRDLAYADGLFHLSGPYVQVEDIQPFELAPATSVDGDFTFTRSDDRFEDVMVYYHLDRYQRYVQTLGFTNLQNGPLRADPHGLSNSDQSLFTPNEGDSYLLFGDGGVDDAEDADVIIHEYGHALSYAAAPDTRVGEERAGLDEGIGDYVAASYSFDLNDWNWFQLFNWDGQNEFWSGRDLTAPLSYPPSGFADRYDYGVIWAACLMSIRAELGATITDRLFFQSLYGLARDMTLMDGARLVLDADSMLYGGAHSMALTRQFCDRNLLSGSSCLAVSATPMPERRWQLASQPDGDLRVQGLAEPLHLTLYNLLGQPLWQGRLAAHASVEVPLSRWPAGVYLLRAQGPTLLLQRKVKR